MQGKASSDQSATTRVYVGIDVCKAWLDVHIHPIGQSFRVENTGKGWKQLRRMLRQYQVALIVMEATGKYHREAHRALHAAGFAVAVVNPYRARLFAGAAGAFAKNDRIDARMLAVMGEGLKPAAVAPTPELIANLLELLRARQAAVDERTALSNQRGETKLKFLERAFDSRIKFIEQHIDKLEGEIMRLLETDPALLRRYEIVLSIKGVGPIAAAWLVIGIAELGSCNSKQSSLLAGLAPLDDDSGDRRGVKHIRGGRGDVRRGIFMSAISAARWNADLKAFYDRLIASGKAHKVAIVAVMRKLVVLANTLLTQDRHWQPMAPKNA